MRTAPTAPRSSPNTPSVFLEVGGPLGDEVQTFWVLYGHLSWNSIARWNKGDAFEQGDVLAAMGDESENGGWAPHVHVQMSLEAPIGGDLPASFTRGTGGRTVPLSRPPADLRAALLNTFEMGFQCVDGSDGRRVFPVKERQGDGEPIHDEAVIEKALQQ